MIFVLLNVTGISAVSAGDRNKKEPAKREKKIAKRTAEVKAGIEKLGVGEDSLVKVKLRDKRKVAGYISKIEQESFHVVDRAGNETVVEYANAKQVKGNNLSKGAWVAIGVGIGLAAMTILVLVAIKASSG